MNLLIINVISVSSSLVQQICVFGVMSCNDIMIYRNSLLVPGFSCDLYSVKKLRVLTSQI